MRLSLPLTTLMLSLTLAGNKAHAISAYPDWYTDTSVSDSIEYLGLEWLTWDKTIDMTIAEALASYSSSGWRLASNIEIASLFNDLFTGDDESFIYTDYSSAGDSDDRTNFDDNENAWQGALNPSVHDSASFFFSQFGLTDYYCDPDDIYGCQAWSSVLFGSDGDSDGLYNRASFNFSLAPYEDSIAIITQDQYSTSTSFESLQTSQFNSWASGVALVRNTVTTGYGAPVSAPEIDSKSSFLVATLLGLIALLRLEAKLGNRLSRKKMTA